MGLEPATRSVQMVIAILDACEIALEIVILAALIRLTYYRKKGIDKILDHLRVLVKKEMKP